MKRWTVLLLLLLVGCGANTAQLVSTAAPQTATAPPTRAVAASPSLSPSPSVSAAVPSTPTPSPLTAETVQPLIAADQQFALKPEQRDPFNLTTLPQYHMLLDVNIAAQTWTGSQIITYTNTTGSTLNDVVLRSYPNFPPDVMGDGGTTRTEVISVAADGVPLNLRVEADATVYRVQLARPLEPLQQTVLATTFKGTLEAWDDGSYPLLSAYPMLAMWDAAANDWRSDITRFPDRVFAQAAWYDVEVTYPRTFQVIGTGSTISSSDNGTTHSTHFVSGPVREWAISFGQFESLQTRTNGITVTVYQTKRNNYDLERVQTMATGALQQFEARFGAYPYRELDVHVMNWDGEGGIEYPGYVFILVSDSVDRSIDLTVAHEVAHQWWYGIAGNDVYREPWLDEALANYSAFVAAEGVFGPQAAQAYYQQEILRLYRAGEANGGAPAGLAISDYPSFNAYYRAVYGKGAVFLATLREQIGDEAFFAGLQAYYNQHTFGIGSRTDFQQAMETSSNRDLTALFNEWLGN